MKVDPPGLTGFSIEGKYRVEAVVGEGGFAIVYRGVDLAFDGAPIAIKCLKIPPGFTHEGRAAFVESFRREGSLLLRLATEPAIVGVRAFGITSSPSGAEVPYLVLEWLEGRGLDEVLAARRQGGLGPFPEREALALLRPVVDAVAAAHALPHAGGTGIAHRDIKPSNVMEVHTRRGVAWKLLDFGIAKAMQEGETATRLVTRTSSGFSAFSPGHGAPEQFQSKKYGPTGPWTDVHALGLLLVELVTGRPALDGEDTYALCASATAAARPTPRARGAVVSDACEALCAKAIAVMPKDRFADAAAMVEAIDAVLGSEAAKGSPTPAPRVGPFGTVAAGPPVVVLGRGAGKSAGDPAPVPAPPRVKRGSGSVILPVVLGVVGALAVAAIAKAVGGGAPAGDAAEGASTGTVGPPVTATAAPAAPAATSAAVHSRAAPRCGAGMVLVPGGTFQMGSAEGTGASDEHPAHAVTLAAFCIDRTEVTVADYRRCVNEPGADTSCAPAPETVKWGTLLERDVQMYSQFCNGDRRDRDRHPINCVDAAQAEAYCRWAGSRLPTEAEWEYAAKGSEGRTYPWGEAEPGPTLLELRNGTVPVGSFPEGKSPFGLFDMAGNVWEWTADWYAPYPNPAAPEVDAEGTSELASGGKRVVRGGGWGRGDNTRLRTALRHKVQALARIHNVGFRCARPPRRGAGGAP